MSSGSIRSMTVDQMREGNCAPFFWCNWNPIGIQLEFDKSCNMSKLVQTVSHTERLLLLFVFATLFDGQRSCELLCGCIYSTALTHNNITGGSGDTKQIETQSPALPWKYCGVYLCYLPASPVKYIYVLLPISSLVHFI